MCRRRNMEALFSWSRTKSCESDSGSALSPNLSKKFPGRGLALDSRQQQQQQDDCQPRLGVSGSDDSPSSDRLPVSSTLQGATGMGGDDGREDSAAEKLGRIEMSLAYDAVQSMLTLKVIRATSLPAKDASGTSDPYVKIFLLPDKKRTLTTSIKRRNLNPRWNETFQFEGFSLGKLLGRVLYLQVLDYDRFSRDDPIGEVYLPLSDVDLSVSPPQPFWKALRPSKGRTGKLGEIQLSLNYHPSVGAITIKIIKARNLKAKDINGLSDPYVKVWLLHEGKKVEKKKTEVHERTLDPTFDETFVLSVPYERIRQTTLQVSVWDHDRLGRNERIGQVILGSKSGPLEVRHWNDMFGKSKTDVVRWHLLKDFG